MMGSDNGDWLKKYHAEHASYGGASHEFHTRAQTWVATRDAEIERLKADVERLTNAAYVQRGQSLEVITSIETVRRAHEVTMRERDAARADLAAHKRALAAGPAALRIDARDGIPWGPYKQLPVEEAVATVEAAQEAAMKEGK